jgi:Holliday junction resolvase
MILYALKHSRKRRIYLNMQIIEHILNFYNNFKYELQFCIFDKLSLEAQERAMDNMIIDGEATDRKDALSQIRKNEVKYGKRYKFYDDGSLKDG